MSNRRRRPDICFVVTSRLVVRFFLVDIINCLSESHDIVLVVNNDHEEDVDLSDIRAEIVHIRIERKISVFRDLAALCKLTWFLALVRPRVVHSISPKGGLLAMTAGFIARIPERIHTFTGQVWVSRRGAMRALLKTLDKALAAFATRLLADSNSQCAFLVEQGIARKDKIRVLASGSVCGVDVGRFAPSPQRRARTRKRLGIEDDACVFLFIGRMNRDKGVLDLGRAFLPVAMRYPHIWLLFVGPDEEGMIDALGRICAPVADRVRFAGYTSRPEDYTAAADVLCLPSYREGFGVMIIEAAASGIPAIGSRIYGITDAVVDGETGMLFPPGDVDTLARAMEKFAADPLLSARMGKAARKRAVSCFSQKMLEYAWEEFYFDILGPRGERSRA